MPLAEPTSSSGRTKRERTRARILANAIALFLHQGIHTTRLVEIAGAAEVVPATLANHFPTKALIVEAWLRGEIGQALVEELDRGGTHRLRAPLRRVSGRVAEMAGASVAAHAEGWALVPRAIRDEPPGLALLAAHLRAEQQSEHVRADLPAEVLARAVWDAIEGGLVAGLADPTPGGAAREPAGAYEGSAAQARIRAAIERRVDLVLDAARRRNERVRPPAAST